MSPSVLLLTPEAELGAQANLKTFVDVWRHSEVLWASHQFDRNTWNIGHLSGHNKVHRAVFSTMEAARARRDQPCLPQPFLDFGKAMLVYLHDIRPVRSQSTRVAALRHLEAALREWSKASRPTAVTADILDTAVDLAKGSMGAGAAYRVAGQLEIIAETMKLQGFASLRQSWNHGLKRPNELGSRISKEALQARQKKLPSAATLRALAGIFSQAIEPRDVLVASYMALMTCAPERINEVLRLERNCIVRGDGRFAGKVGLRWPGSKGATDTVKWLPSAMVPVAEQALDNLLKLSAPAQAIAAWYTENPDSLYLNEAATHLRGRDVLTLEELALILWGDEGTKASANQWARTSSQLQRVSLGKRKVGYLYKDVETAVLKLLPATFPHTPGAPRLLCKDSLGLVRRREMSSDQATFKCMFACVDHKAVTSPLARVGKRPSIFERFQYTEDDGSPISLHSHSLRHYLNMLAHVGGMTSAEIALFSGRKDISQNRAYDHMSSDEVQQPISRALKAGMTGALVTEEPRRLMHRIDFARGRPRAAHTTEYGSCTHDFASEPCQVNLDCINCDEQECIKGDARAEGNLRSKKTETELLLATAREAYSEAAYGADIWVKHQTRTLEVVNALLAVLDDPQVPIGAHIRLKKNSAPLVTTADSEPVCFIETTNRALR